MATPVSFKHLALGFALLLGTASTRVFADAPAAQSLDAGEQESPDSVINKDRAAPVRSDGKAYEAQLRAAESGSPDSIDASRAVPQSLNPRSSEADFRAAEAGNPHSIDSNRGVANSCAPGNC